MQPLNVLMVASEVAPFAKTGGLADMVAGLSAALAARGHTLRIVCPAYPSVEPHVARRESIVELPVLDGGGTRSATVERMFPKEAGGGSAQSVEFYAIRQDVYFGRRGLYQESGQDYPDNLARFAFFCRAALGLVDHWVHREGWVPDVIHAHDWQAALVPAYLRTTHAGAPWSRHVRSVLTLHNVGYQGIFPADQFPQLGLEAGLFTPQGLEFYGSVNLLKGGVIHADALTTVSPTYCQEIQTPEYGFGLEGVFRERRDRLVGIVNGIDTDVWNPATDRWLPANYSSLELGGKAVCKRALQRERGLPAADVPLFAMVSRLVAQKGVDLVMGAAPVLVRGGGQLIVLGTGEPELEAGVEDLASRFPAQVNAVIGFDEGLAHRIQAGADAFLVPSRYEPCGLTQLCSLRYGTVPVVRRTGGLADTVKGVSEGASPDADATGFVFESADAAALGSAIRQTIRCFERKADWQRLVQQGMQRSVGWEDSAIGYEGVYQR